MNEPRVEEQRRKLQGQPRTQKTLISTMNVPLPVELETELHAQAQAVGRPPETYAAYLIVQGMHIQSVIEDIEQPVLADPPPKIRPQGLRQLVLGTVVSRAPHHARLIRDLLGGGVLIERRHQVFELFLTNGQSRSVNPSMVFNLLAKDVLRTSEPCG